MIVSASEPGEALPRGLTRLDPEGGQNRRVIAQRWHRRAPGVYVLACDDFEFGGRENVVQTATPFL